MKNWVDAIDKLESELRDLANKDYSMNEDVYDLCGGNYDDAFNLGESQGRINLAQELLNKYFN